MLSSRFPATRLLRKSLRSRAREAERSTKPFASFDFAISLSSLALRDTWLVSYGLSEIACV